MISLMRSKSLYLLVLLFLMLSILSSFLWLFSDALKRNFNFTETELLGADGSVESAQALPKEMEGMAKHDGIKLSHTINFSSMMISEKKSTLGHVRAIDKAYPLKGQIKIQTKQGVLTEAKLEPDQIWIDEALKTRLGVSLFDFIQLGQHRFQVSGIIVSEPARAGMAFMLAPKSLIRIEDVLKTGLVQPYSRVLYQSFIKAEDSALKNFQLKVKAKFKNIKTYSAQEGRSVASPIFNMGERYIGIFIVVTVVLSGMGMMALAQANASENRLMIALLKTFGGGFKRIRKLYFLIFLVLGMGIILFSFFIAFIGIAFLHKLYPNVIAFSLSYLLTPEFGKILLIQTIASLVVLFGFAFVPILQALKTSPMMLFRKEAGGQSVWPMYVLAEAITLVLLLLYIPNASDVLMLFGYFFMATLVSGLFFYGIFFLIKCMPMNFFKILIFSRKVQNGLLATQFSLVFLLGGLLWVISHDFLGTWLSSLPAHTPNQFMINITEHHKQDIEKFWQDEGVSLSLFPMITARLKSVNNETRPFYRTLNISYRHTLPEDNKITIGSSWGKHLSGESVISIEENFAKSIQAKIGDDLIFEIAGKEIRAKVLNSRRVKWESFKPNFYVIFPEKVLEDFPKTYMASIYLPPEKMQATLKFLKQFPGVSLIDVKLNLEQVRFLLVKVVKALSYMIGVILILACLVYYAMISRTFIDRQYESALLRNFGASKAKLRQVILLEFGLIGGLSGGLGLTLAIVLAMVLSEKLSMTYAPHWGLILVGGALGGVLTMGIGWLVTHKVINTPPSILLREGV